MSVTPISDADDVLRIPAAGRSWIIVHTRPRAEKKLVDFCQRQNMPTYLPLRTKVHRYGQRERKFSSPLFSGYMFCVADPQQRATVRQNRMTANVLDVLNQQQLVGQLIQIRQALAAGDVLKVMPFLETGKRVRVIAGPLKGLEGIVQRIKNKARIVLNVDMIRQAVVMEVDSAFLGPL